MSENTHIYIGTLPCGCNVAAEVDVVGNKKETAKHVAEMIKNGLSVTRHALQDLRGGTVKISHCIHKEEARLL